MRFPFIPGTPASLLCAFPQTLWLSPLSHSDVLEPLQCLNCPHVTAAVCLLFGLECEFDLEEIKVTWDFQRKLGDLGMSRVFWNRQWFGLSQHKQKQRSSLLGLSCGFRVTEIWEALGEMKKASLSLKSSASPLGQEGICAWLWMHS